LKNVTVYNGPANGNNLGGVKNNGGTLKVFRSTFVGNNALAVGGGIANISDGTLTVKNSTFSGHKAGSAGGGILNDGTLKVTYVTFSGNDAELIGGGIQNANDKGATVRLDKAVLANSPNGNINNVCAAGQCRGKIIDGGYNISDDASFRFTTPISKSRTNPKLDTDGLKYNGGPHRDHSPANDLPRRQLHSQRHERLRNHHEDRSARGTQAPRQEVRRGSFRADAAALERLAKGLTFCEPRFQLSAVSRQLLADR
jgi:hypothetical protein